MALKKRIFVILAVCMAVTLLAGCGAANRQEALPADSNAAAAEDVLVAGDMEKPDEGLEGEPARPVVTPEEDGIEVERRPWYEDEVIDLAKEQITWNYYAVTAEQNTETGEWTVTFWSRDRETFQTVMVDRYGGVWPFATQDEAVEPIIIKVSDFFIEQAKTQVHWDYYAHTAEQDPETGDWTVTFWSQDREKFQVVIGCQFGIGQTVQLPANQEEAITIADAYKTFAYYAATAEQDPETGDWTVMFWSRDRETSQMVIVSEFRPILVEPAVEQASILHKLMEIEWP